jgi:hypothetical protein
MEMGEALESHPTIPRKYTHTSYVVAHNKTTGEIETRNSRYTLIGEERKPEVPE